MRRILRLKTNNRFVCFNAHMPIRLRGPPPPPAPPPAALSPPHYLRFGGRPAGKHRSSTCVGRQAGWHMHWSKVATWAVGWLSNNNSNNTRPSSKQCKVCSKAEKMDGHHPVEGGGIDRREVVPERGPVELTVVSTSLPPLFLFYCHGLMSVSRVRAQTFGSMDSTSQRAQGGHPLDCFRKATTDAEVFIGFIAIPSSSSQSPESPQRVERTFVRHPAI